jgi:dihydroneopterin aldolase
MNMDIVFIKGLKIDTVIGIYDWERKIRQNIILDIEMSFDIKKAAQTDLIENTLDYKAVSKRLISFVQEAKYELVEKLAQEICNIILNEFPVKKVRLKLDKGKVVTDSDAVGVIIERP